MNINWAAPTIDILNLDYPPIINIFFFKIYFTMNSVHLVTQEKYRVEKLG